LSKIAGGDDITEAAREQERVASLTQASR